MTTATVSSNLRRWRRAFDRTLADVSTATGITIPELSRIERRKATPSAEALERIAGALGLQGPARQLFLIEAVREFNFMGGAEDRR